MTGQAANEVPTPDARPLLRLAMSRQDARRLKLRAAARLGLRVTAPFRRRIGLWHVGRGPELLCGRRASGLWIDAALALDSAEVSPWCRACGTELEALIETETARSTKQPWAAGARRRR